MAQPSFNPRARVGRDSALVTSCSPRPWFQSTRPRGARPDPPNYYTSVGRFQSTRPRGARLLNIRGPMRGPLFQSTRPRGARPDPPNYYTSVGRFQSTRPRGARPHPDTATAQAVAAFQSTRPRGARRRVPRARRARRRFNPRARVGRDAASCGRFESRGFVSIHAPAWGATDGGAIMIQGSAVSIHAPAWGATRGPRCVRA